MFIVKYVQTEYNFGTIKLIFCPESGFHYIPIIKIAIEGVCFKIIQLNHVEMFLR